MDIRQAIEQLPSPCYVVDLSKLEANCQRLAQVQERTGAKVLLAMKGFAMHATFPLVSQYLSGVCASSVHEAQLGNDYFPGELHAYAPAFSDQNFIDLFSLADHITLNSIAQWQRFQALSKTHPNELIVGLRVNPEYSEVEVDLYNPCAPGSRLGIRAESLSGAELEGLTGLHFHTLCEQDSKALAGTLEALESRFGTILNRQDIAWLNMGGGHHITREDYDLDHLCALIDHMQSTYQVQVYLEPGEAVALNTGYLSCTVLDMIENTLPIAILDTSATAHMPDVLEMPYRPQVIGWDEANADATTVRLGGLTCLAGDVVGDYKPDHIPEIGDRLVFADMAHYTMVKNSTFNGVPLPAIATFHPDDSAPTLVREFGYADYRDRLS